MLSGLASVCFQAEDGIRDLVRSRGLGDVYKRQMEALRTGDGEAAAAAMVEHLAGAKQAYLAAVALD